MKIFLKYLLLPSITTCIIIIIIFSHLYSSKNTDIRAARNNKKFILKDDTTKEANYSPYISRSNKDFIYPAESMRDPFRKFSTPAIIKRLSSEPVVEQPSIMLTGIIWDEEKPIAIIRDSNNNTYLAKAGEEIGKIKVLSIKQRSITIKRDGKIAELVLWPSKSKI